MESSIFREITQLVREHKTAARVMAVFLCLAVVVTVATVGVLTFTGQAMTQQVKVLTCQYTPHRHTAACQNAEGQYVCGYADYVVHIHNDDCYDENGTLVCPLPEVWPHTHSDACYTEVKNVICGLEETPAHVHTAECYNRERGELTCTQEEHVHGDECFYREQILTCDKTEQEHIHTDACYIVTRDLTCGLEESEEHTHSDACYTENRVLNCDLVTEPHVHGPECYTLNETLICQIPEHTHTDDCYAWTETLICTIPEGTVPEGGHVHTDECFETHREMTCGKLENHTHTDECFALPDGTRSATPICGKIELLEHVHGDDCFTIEERQVEGSGLIFFDSTGEDPEAEGVPAAESEYICGKTEHTHDDTCKDEAGQIVCGLEEHVHDENCVAPAEEAAEGAESAAPEYICGKTEHTHDDTCKDEAGQIVCGLEEHVHDENCIAPAEETPVYYCGKEEHIHDASCMDAAMELICGKEEHVHDETCLVAEEVLTKTFQDGSVLITASYTGEAGIPDEAELRAAPLTAESDPELYARYMETVATSMGHLDAEKSVLYDIGFFMPDGTEIEPAGTVTVSIQFLTETALSDGRQVTVVHFAQDGTEILPSVSENGEISFETDSFSPFLVTKQGIFKDVIGFFSSTNSDGSTGFRSEVLDAEGKVPETMSYPLEYTYNVTFDLSADPVTLTLPKAVSCLSGSRTVIAVVKGDDGENKTITLGTIAYGTDGTITWTPTEKGAAAIKGGTIKDEPELSASVHFTLDPGPQDGTLELPGLESISVEPRDMKDFQVRSELKQGERVLGEGDSVVVGEHYTFEVDFEESGTNAEQRFSNPMQYQLPDNVKWKAESNVPITDREYSLTEPAGWYDVDENGLVTFHFSEDYLKSKSNLKLQTEFEMTVAEDSEGQVTFPWGHGDEEKTFKTDYDPDATLTKTAGDYVPNDVNGPYIEYTVELEITKGVVKDPTLKDVMHEGLSLQEGSVPTIVVTDEYGKVIPLDPQPTLEKTEDGWEIKDLPELSKGQKVTVSYRAGVNFEELGLCTAGGGSVNYKDVDNTVTFTGTKPVSGDPLEREANAPKSFSDTRLKKSGNKDTSDSRYPNDLDWEIDLGSGSGDVRSSIVYDDLDGDHWFNPDRPLELKWKDVNGTTIKTYYIPWDKAKDYGLKPKYDTDGKPIIGFEFDLYKTLEEGMKGYTDKDLTDSKKETFWLFTDEDENTREWQNGDRLKIEYYTTYPEAQADNGSFQNSARVSADPYVFGVDGTVSVGASHIDKNVEDLGDYLQYTVGVDIPKFGDFLDIIGKKDRDGTGKYEGRIRFWLRDQLEFGSVKYEDADGSTGKDRYFVENIPQDLTITAEITHDDGTTESVQFVEGGKEPYNFHVAAPITCVGDLKEDGRKTIRQFEIWFNHIGENWGETGGSNDHENSYWMIKDECHLTITYKIPKSAKLVLEHPQSSGNYFETDLTMGQLLEQGNTLTNEVVGHGRGDRKLTAQRKYTVYPPQGGVEKTAQVLNVDGGTEIEYRVAFNGFTVDPETEKYGEFYINPNTFRLTDTYDSRLEYVPGSLQIEVYAPDSMRQRYTFEYKEDNGNYNNPEFDIGKERTTLKAFAEYFNYRSYQGNSSWDTYTKLSDYMNGNRDALYVFTYRLKLKDEGQITESMTLHNEAEVTYNDKSTSDVANVYFEPDLLDKTGVLITDKLFPMMAYEVDVNPYGADLGYVQLPDADEPTDLPNYTLTDKMDPSLELDYNSVEVYRVAEGGSETKLTLVSKQEEVTQGGDNYVFRPGDDNSFTLVLPDREHLRIRYQAYLYPGDGSGTVSGNVANTVSLSGGLTLAERHDAEFEVDSSNANIKGDASLRIFKRDASTGDYIDGATLTLYTLPGEGVSTTPGEIAIEDGLSNLMQYEAISPTALAGATIGPEKGYDGYYVLIETKAPGGYLLSNQPVVLKFGEPPEDGPETVTVGYKGVAYTMKVQYIRTGDNVVVFDDEPEAYTLPESGGIGSDVLYLAGAVLIASGAGLLVVRKRKGARA